MSKKPEEYDDIPGTWVFDAERARKGYHLNAFFYSPIKAENRVEFLANERKYLERFPMTETQRDAVMKRDWNALLELGGVSYAIVKLAFTDKKSYQHMASKMAGVSESEYVQMMFRAYALAVERARGRGGALPRSRRKELDPGAAMIVGDLKRQFVCGARPIVGPG